MKQRLVSRFPFAEGNPYIPLSQRTLFIATCCLLIIFGVVGGLGGVLLSHSHPAAHAQAPNNGDMPVGLNVDINIQSKNDMIENDPRFQGVNNGALTEDANGDLSSDFEWVIDNRYALAWVAGATDVDPLKFSEDLSGDYTLTFTGQATLSVDNAGDPAHSSITISNQSYDAGSNTTTATVTFGKPAGGLVGGIQFTSTKRMSSDTAGNGVTNLHLWRPGYKTASNPIFTDLWINSIKNYNWSALRFMDSLGTNGYAQPTSQEVYPYRLNWNTDRLQPGKGPAYGYNHVGVHGSLSWEEVVIIAQLTHKDIWINIPVNASDEYVTHLANLFKNGNQYTNNQGIPDDVTVYVEYTNEAWHYGFPQGSWNLAAAHDEVKAGNTTINYDGTTNDDNLRFRRLAEQTIKYGNTFKSAFNDNGTRIRPVINNSFVGNDVDMLSYVSKEYGSPSQYLYGVSQATYYTSTDRSSVQSILNTLKTSSDSNVKAYIEGRAIATYYGLHQLAYEGGEGDTQAKADGSGNETDQELYNQFAASRDPGMQDVEMHALTDWFQSGGELYMHFSQVGHYSIYGFWGLSEDLTNQSTGKWKGYIQAMNTPTPAPTVGTAISGSGPTNVDVTTDVFGNGFNRPGTGAGAFFLLNVAQSGTYDIKITTNANGPQNGGMGQAQAFVNNHQVGGTANMPPSSTVDFGSVQLQAGLNTLFIYSVHGSNDPAYPNDFFHDQWQPVNVILTPTSVSSGTPTPTPTPTSGGKTGPVLAGVAAGKCLDVRNRATANGTPIQLWSCNQTPAQQWTVASNGSLQALGKCLDVTGGATANGTLVQLWDCNGTGAQEWVVSNGGLKNPQSGRCLDVPNASTTDGTQLQIWDCNGTNAQKWTLPG